MEIVFGMSLDGPSFPAILTNDAAGMGKMICGPLGLLRLLETRTGLGGDWAPQPLRVELYRQRLNAVDDGTRFFTDSLEADSHTVAETLLAWRDELYLAGWNFAFTDDLPARLKDFALVEQGKSDLPPLPFGFPERFRAVVAALPQRNLLITAITLAEPRRLLNTPWEQLLAALEQGGVTVTDWTAPAPQATGDLRAAQEALLSGGERTAAGDGSLILLSSESDVHAADIIGAWLEIQPLPNRLLLLPRSDRTLERIITVRGLPALGCPNLFGAAADPAAVAPSL